MEEFIKEGNLIIAEGIGSAIVDSEGNHKNPEQYDFHNNWNSMNNAIERIESFEDEQGFQLYTVIISTNNTIIKNNVTGFEISGNDSYSRIMATFRAVIELFKSIKLKNDMYILAVKHVVSNSDDIRKCARLIDKCTELPEFVTIHEQFTNLSLPELNAYAKNLAASFAEAYLAGYNDNSLNEPKLEL